MARINFFGPIENVPVRPGVIYREDDQPGAAKHITLPPEAKERADKGDLGETSIPNFEPRPLTGGHPPFNLKPGKGV